MKKTLSHVPFLCFMAFRVSVPTPSSDVTNVFVCFYSRHHHSVDHVHHHHRGQRLHAAGLLHQGSGHLPLGQFRLCLPVGDRVCGGQLPLHRPREEREETKGESKCFFSSSDLPLELLRVYLFMIYELVSVYLPLKVLKNATLQSNIAGVLQLHNI